MQKAMEAKEPSNAIDLIKASMNVMQETLDDLENQQLIKGDKNNG